MDCICSNNLSFTRPKPHLTVSDPDYVLLSIVCEKCGYVTVVTYSRSYRVVYNEKGEEIT